MGPSSRWSLNQATLSSVNYYSRRRIDSLKMLPNRGLLPH